MATTRVGIRVFHNPNMVGFVTFLDLDSSYGLLPIRSKTIFFLYEIFGAVFFLSVTKQWSWINMQNTIPLHSKVISVIYYK
jgi:hypothetical protein